ncbi:transcription factor spt8 [Zygosaccharomyces mellis]|uniref:Transcription factor spt8 n=1 Tax=Zygosaccharomyces mellis TaxID=42258 RepID=A0A4C2EC85_9SACH|nr:transcription factor spt8 [Zygosaccharomyces mellis]
MDDVDDILNNGRAAEEDMADEDEEVEEDEGEGEEVDAGQNDDDEDEADDDDEGLELKSGVGETGNQDDDDNDNDNDDEGDEEENDEEEDESDVGSESGNDLNGENVSQHRTSSNDKSQEMERGEDQIKIDSKETKDGDEGERDLDGTPGINTGEQPDQEDQDVEMKEAAVDGGNGANTDGEKASAASKFDKLHNYYTQMLRSAKISDTYNIYPTAAIPIQTNVNALAMSKGLKYLFLGGSDGFIRKYDFLNTMDGKLALTILQKHSLAESIQNAGILVSYWENEIPQKRSEIRFLKNNKEYEPKISPVHSLEVQSECLFLLSGLDNGGITLQGVRYMEGSIGHYFKGKEGHNNVVNLLKLSGTEDRFFSGSWDKRLLEWDLQTGSILNEFKGGASEYSALEMRPQYSSVNINEVAAELKASSGQGQDEDDDMGSLFGDDEEEDYNTKPDIEGEKTSENVASSLEEISKTTLNVVYDESVFMTSGLNGSVHIWDRRTTNAPVLKLERGPKVPPWCQSACWSMDGDHVYVGRRNAVVEEFDLKNPTQPSNTLKLPGISGPVSCIKAMPNNRQILCASKDNIRIYDTKADFSKGSTIPFLIVPGHHGGSISNLYVDPTCRFLVSTSGTRGWQGNSTDTTFIYEIELG